MRVRTKHWELVQLYGLYTAFIRCSSTYKKAGTLNFGIDGKQAGGLPHRADLAGGGSRDSMGRRNRPFVFLASPRRLALTLVVAAQAVLAATVAAVPCGDVNGDGVVDIGDALVVAQFDVGLRLCGQLAHPEACDVNGDGACNIGDALRISQCDVGLINCAFTCGPFTCPSTTSTTTSTTTTSEAPTTTTTSISTTSTTVCRRYTAPHPAPSLSPEPTSSARAEGWHYTRISRRDGAKSACYQRPYPRKNFSAV